MIKKYLSYISAISQNDPCCVFFHWQSMFHRPTALQMEGELLGVVHLHNLVAEPLGGTAIASWTHGTLAPWEDHWRASRFVQRPYYILIAK